jgi:F0F1-type ATP synthase assembly protein I
VVPDRNAITGDLGVGVDFISSVIAGLLLGLGLDWVFGTSPVIVIVGIVAGFVTGFLKLWRQSAVLEEHAIRRTAWEPKEEDADG